MKLLPTDWNVIVVGRWNRAILTPAGIGKRVFKLGDGNPLEVLIAIDALAPPQVRYEGMTVIAGSDRLIIQPSVLTFDELTRACQLAINAIDDLPQTPFVAVGYNVRYASVDCIAEVDEVINATIDQHASDAKYTILERNLSRSMKRQYGKLNITATISEDQSRNIALNFETQSNDPEALKHWLAIETNDLAAEVRTVIETILHIPTDTIEYESTTKD